MTPQEAANLLRGLPTKAGLAGRDIMGDIGANPVVSYFKSVLLPGKKVPVEKVLKDLEMKQDMQERMARYNTPGFMDDGARINADIWRERNPGVDVTAGPGAKQTKDSEEEEAIKKSMLEYGLTMALMSAGGALGARAATIPLGTTGSYEGGPWNTGSRSLRDTRFSYKRPMNAKTPAPSTGSAGPDIHASNYVESSLRQLTERGQGQLAETLRKAFMEGVVK